MNFFAEIIAFFEEENYVFDEEEGKETNYAFEISILYSNQSEIFKKELNAVFLSGNDIALIRLKKELTRINTKTNEILGDDAFWEGGTFGELLKAKAFFTEDLIQYINDRLSPLQQKTANLKSKKKEIKSIEDYLTDEGKKLLPKLVKPYKNCKKPIKMAYMWHAMNDLTTLIAENISTSAELYRLLKGTFGDIGSYANFNKNMKRLEKGRDRYQDSEIADHIAKIKSLQ